MASFVISDGTRERELVYDGSEGIFLTEAPVLPLTANEVTYAETADGEGRRPLRKRPQSPTASAKVAISAYDPEVLRDLADDLQDLITSMDRSESATIRFTLDDDADAVTYDVTVASVTGLPLGETIDSGLIENVDLQFECGPFGRLEPVSIFTNETFSGPVDSVEISGVPGHVDAWGALELSEASGEQRGFIEVGQADDYTLSESLQLALPDLSVSGTGGTSTTRSGSYSANVARATIATGPTVVVKSDRLTHKGKKRMRTRVYASTEYVQVRLAWRVGDSAYSYSPWRSVPAASTWLEVVLDNVNIQPLPEGTHYWDFRIEARTTTGTATIDVDTCSAFPADRYCVLRQIDEGAGMIVSAYDDGTLGSGALNGDSANIGGSYTTSGGTGDFSTDGSNHRIQRTQTADSAGAGRFALLPVSHTDIDITVEFGISAGGATGAILGCCIRYVDPNNYVLVYAKADSFTSPPGASVWVGYLVKCVSGVRSTVATFGFGVLATLPSLKARCVIDESGAYALTPTVNGAVGTEVVGVESSFATGGALESGSDLGWYDEYTSGTACTRWYDNLIASTTDAPSPVIYDSGALLLTHEAALRESEDGYTYGNIAGFRGKHLLIPPATLNEKKTLMAIRARRFNIDDGLIDSGLSDSLTGNLEVTPRVLLLPR
jgi:hypothetical protein